MNKKFCNQKLSDLLEKCESSILYLPLKNEIDYREKIFPIKIYENNIILPIDKNSDPFVWADKCKSELNNKSTYILIPGEKFDIQGTRHGHGYGWYDRFLSKIPNSWIRIGVTDISKLSLKPIIKKTLDESVDWIIVYDSSCCSWKFYETFARNN
ncbi:MAG: 5-formyltetrahydrofolate cyclo-ligase [Candidatus Pacebacteria bacterium]|nr:5-formyltetrahydrofolate cyclo-ligase [Candidatus Paceibacterota bacterium]